MKRISCLLVANRSEIAVRIIRACRDLGIRTISAASEADRESLPAQTADRVACIGPPPPGERIRVDTHGHTGYFVPPYYDSLLAKVITWGQNRLEAISQMQKALGDFHVSGVDTTIPFHRFLLRNPSFIQGVIHTHWIEDILLKEFEQNARDHLC
jgi:acetyl/propionyl-CoA carboxylase alpha subunit